jgi:hypothetical protein
LIFSPDFLTPPAQLAFVTSSVVDSIDLCPVFLSQARIWSQQAVTAKQSQPQIQTILADFLENQVPVVCTGCIFLEQLIGRGIFPFRLILHENGDEARLPQRCEACLQFHLVISCVKAEVKGFSEEAEC